jgi:transcriptional regulator with XRE-family HTH domain
MSDTIGVRLKRAREERRLTIPQAASATRIRSHYLEALEKDDLSRVPSAAQARGFLRIYAEFLGLDPEDLAPRPWTPEPMPTPEPALPPSEPAAVPVQKTDVVPTNPAPGLLARLRMRLSRRADVGSDEHAQDSVEPAAEGVPQNPAASPESFVPVRSKEEMPEVSAPAVDEKGGGEIPTVKRTSKGKSASSKGTKTRAVKFSSEQAAADLNARPLHEVGNEPQDLKKKTH